MAMSRTMSKTISFVIKDQTIGDDEQDDEGATTENMEPMRVRQRIKMQKTRMPRMCRGRC